MFILKDLNCSRCGGEIQVFGYTEKDKHGKTRTIVDYGQCTYCGKIEILPQDDFREFTYLYCRKRN